MQSFQSRLIYNYFKMMRTPFITEAPLKQQRDYLERQGRMAFLPLGVSVKAAVIGEMYAEWLRPDVAIQGRVMLYLHGGGYTMGSCNTHRAMVSRIARASQTTALLIEYRLAPEHPFPAALDDCQRAYEYLLDEGYAPSRIIVAGDSAGGGLALALMLKLRDAGGALPGLGVLISAWADLTMSGESVAACALKDVLISEETSLKHAHWYLGGHDPKLPYLSPVFGDLRGLPPLLVQVGECEILRSDSMRIVENAHRDGVEAELEVWDGMWHVWHGFAGIVPEANRAIERIGEFVRTLG